MNRSLPTRALREHPDLDQLKRQSKELLQAYIAGDEKTVAEVNAHYHDADRQKFALHDAQLVLARAYGFESWPKLKAYVDGVTLKRLVDAVRTDDTDQVRVLLKIRPELAHMSMDNLQVLHHAVLNRSPEMVRILMHHGAHARDGVYPHRDGFATALLDAGARTDLRDYLLKSTPLGWACRWGRIELVKLLLQKGADPLEPDAEPWATPEAWARKMGHDHIIALLHSSEECNHDGTG